VDEDEDEGEAYSSSRNADEEMTPRRWREKGEEGEEGEDEGQDEVQRDSPPSRRLRHPSHPSFPSSLRPYAPARCVVVIVDSLSMRVFAVVESSCCRSQAFISIHLNPS